MFKKKFNQLTNTELIQFNSEYDQLKKELPYDLNGVNLPINFDVIKKSKFLKLTKNKDDFKIAFIESDLTSYGFKLDSSFMLKVSNKIDMCIIECDLIPYQYFNKLIN